MKSFRRSLKGISPIFATLILIAIAVIAGIVVYMFTSGFVATLTGGGGAGQEKAAVQGFSLTQAGAYSIYAQSTSGNDITITSIILKNQAGTTLNTVDLTANNVLTADGALVTLTGTGLTGASQGDPVTLTLVSTKGGSFVSSSGPVS